MIIMHTIIIIFRLLSIDLFGGLTTGQSLHAYSDEKRVSSNQNIRNPNKKGAKAYTSSATVHNGDALACPYDVVQSVTIVQRTQTIAWLVEGLCGLADM